MVDLDSADLAVVDLDSADQVVDLDSVDLDSADLAEVDPVVVASDVPARREDPSNQGGRIPRLIMDFTRSRETRHTI